MDDDVPDIIVSTPITTSEPDILATFTIVLTSEPFDQVTITCNSGDSSEGVVLNSPVTFNSVNWNVPQVVTVQGQDDTVVDGDVNYYIVVTSSSTDSAYNNITKIVDAVNLDDDIYSPGMPGPTPSTSRDGRSTGLIVS